MCYIKFGTKEILSLLIITDTNSNPNTNTNANANSYISSYFTFDLKNVINVLFI